MSLTSEEYKKVTWLIESRQEANYELVLQLLIGKDMTEWEVLVWIANQLVAKGSTGSVCVSNKGFSGTRSDHALRWFYMRLGCLYSFEKLICPEATEDDLHVAFGELVALFGWSYKAAGARIVYDLLCKSKWRHTVFPESEGDFDFLGRALEFDVNLEGEYVDVVFRMNCAIFQNRVPEYQFRHLLVNRFLQSHRVLDI